MAIAWSEIFDNFGVKSVTATDKGKGAYVPNSAQLAAIKAAGREPSESRPAEEFPITILFDDRKAIRASFYHALRTTDPSRRPEPRMGHEFISSDWLHVGDKLVIGNIGQELFAARISEHSQEEAAFAVVSRASQKTIFEQAKKSSGHPATRAVTRNDFVRNPYVVAAALIRSGGTCEMPSCDRSLFKKSDGSVYLEVHHITPLSEGGEDTLGNVAALCPHCHRELHFGKNRAKRREAVAKHVTKLERDRR